MDGIRHTSYKKDVLIKSAHILMLTFDNNVLQQLRRSSSDRVRYWQVRFYLLVDLLTNSWCNSLCVCLFQRRVVSSRDLWLLPASSSRFAMCGKVYWYFNTMLRSVSFSSVVRFTCVLPKKRKLFPKFKYHVKFFCAPTFSDRSLRRIH